MFRTPPSRTPLVFAAALAVLLVAACGPSQLEQDLTAANEQLTARVAELEANVATFESEATAGAEALAAAEAEIAAAGEALAAAEAEAATIQAALTAAEAEVDATRAALAEAEAEVDATRAALATAEAEALTASDALTATESERTALQERVAALEGELADAVRARDAARDLGMTAFRRDIFIDHDADLDDALDFLQALFALLALRLELGLRAGADLLVLQPHHVVDARAGRGDQREHHQRGKEIGPPTPHG